MKNVFSFKKPLVWILIAALLIAVVATIWSFANRLSTAVSDALDACVVSALQEEYVSDYTAGKQPVVAYTVLGVKEKRDTTIVYGVMMYREYTCTTQDELKTWGTAHAPFALTVKAAGDGYEAVACQWPEEGAGYEKSVKKLFPSSLREKVINFQRYYGPNDQACSAKALAAFATEDKYTVMQSERENVWLAYQEQGTHAYVVSTAGYSATGTYALNDKEQIAFTFGTCLMVLDVEGNAFHYNTMDSQRVPTAWEADSENTYLDKETYFKPLVRGETTRVGKTLVVDGGMSTMSEDEIRKIFGYVPNNDGSEDRPYYRPVKLLTSRPQLDMLLAQYLESTVWTGLNQQNFTQYDEAFFEKNSLVMVYYQDGTYQAEPSIASFVYTEDYSCLSVRLSVDKPAAADAAVGQWLLFAGIAKSDMEGISVLEAYVEQTTEGDGKTLYQGTDLSFTGKVEQVEGNAMLMSCYDVDQFVQGVWVNLGDIELDPMVGEEYVVTYEDMMMPSLPPRITAITVTKP